MIHHNTQIGYPPTSSGICASCDARLTALRQSIMAILDAARVMQLLEVYFVLRDNWHDCHACSGGGLEV